MIEFEITEMKIGDHEVKIPHGLSDLLNDAGVWKPRKEKKESNNYDCHIRIDDGNFVTLLTKKKEETK